MRAKKNRTGSCPSHMSHKKTNGIGKPWIRNLLSERASGASRAKIAEDIIVIKVDGPAQTMRFISDYMKENPGLEADIRSDAEKYKWVLRDVKRFKRRHPSDFEDGTYDALTGEAVEFEAGYMVSFHQNHSVRKKYSDYTDEGYALMCAISKRELKTEEVYIGYFERSAEASLHCDDYMRTLRFAIENNQKSVWDCRNQRNIVNPFRDKGKNPCPDD